MKTSTHSSAAALKKVAKKATAASASKKVAKKPAAAASKKVAKPAPASPTSAAASKKIDQRIAELGDWRGETLARLRKLIHEVEPAIVEEWKWMGTPVWYRDGGVCTGESYKLVVKLTFFRGAALADPKQLFNSSLEGNVRRAIDFHDGEKINEPAFKALIRAAITANTEAITQRSLKTKAKTKAKA